MKPFIIALLALAACNQTITQPGPVNNSQFDPLWIRRPEGGSCSRRDEVCRPATSDYPRGYCAYVGDNGRAYGSKRAQSADADGGR